MLRETALDHLGAELDVRTVAWARLERDDRVACPVHYVTSRDDAPVGTREPAAPQLRERGREVADVRRLVLLDVLDERAGLVVAAEQRAIAEDLARPAERLDREDLDDEHADHP